ncbi:MAG: DinB family protein [Candidatus Odinarchaeota archaeon]
MVYSLLKKATVRHVEETRRLIDQLTDQAILSEPVVTGRPLGEVILHMIRSLEYYSRGLATGVWEALPYKLETYHSAKSIKALYEDVVKRVAGHIEVIPANSLDEKSDEFNRPATRGEILLEMLEHSIQHRGQVLVYYRLLDIEPAKIPYII